MIRLTKRDWAEIYYALDSKIRALRDRRLGEEMAPGQDARWLAHLKNVMCKIGSDGFLAHEKGVQPKA